MRRVEVKAQDVEAPAQSIAFSFNGKNLIFAHKSKSNTSFGTVKGLLYKTFYKIFRALDSFFPLVRLTFSVGRTSTWFGCKLFFFFNIWLINACWLTFIIVYSYMVTEVFNIQPVIFHQYYLWFKFCDRNSSFCFHFHDLGVTLYKKR